MASETLETPNSLSPFLNLPFDILFGVVNYLSFRDIIALSLTAKGLRGLCPPHPSFGEQKAICFSHIQHGYLPKPVIPPQPHKCPYCRVPICPPTCRTAIILDSDSGFCFPRNLFPVHLATFKYADTTHGNLYNFQTFPPRRRPSATEYPYSTIWCEHHRCPKDLLANEKYYDIENGMGATLFVREYEWWRQNKVLCHEVDVGYWIHDRWTVGYKKPLTLSARFRNLGLYTRPFVPKYPGFTEDEIEDLLDDTDNNNDDDLAPIHEKFYYDKMCLHCLSAVPRISPRKDFRQGNFLAYGCECIDEASVTSLAQPNVAVNPWITPARLTRKAVRSRGCLNCGTASVKFTRIEAFDFVEDNECDRLNARGKGLRREGFWVYLATKCQIGYDICPTAVEKERLYPVDPEQHSELSNIVRGYKLVPFPKPAPKIGIQNLPYNVLFHILQQLSGASRYMAMQSSYCFLRAYRQYAPTRFHITEPYYIILYHFRSQSNTRLFSETKEFMAGQRSHIHRKLDFETQRKYFETMRD